MSKKILELSQEISDIIYNFFDGELIKLTKDNIKKVYNDSNINIDYKYINKDNYKDLLRIDKIKRTKSDIRIILKKQKNIIEVDTDKSIDKSIDKKEIIEYKDIKGEKYVSFQRKAFIDFINKDFHRRVIRTNKDLNSDRDPDKNYNIWQTFVKEYLKLESPYRGLLVYHGLGTGKTATAITTAEGLSENMNITTLLPASLETNFVEEVKNWGSEMFDLNNNNWIFIGKNEIIEDTNIKVMLNKKYNITLENIDNIYNISKKKTNESIEPGFWIINDDTKQNREKIKTISGFIIKNNRDTEIEVRKLSNGEIIQLNNQIEICIRLKYNFIHYNPFPKVKNTNIKEFLKTNEDEPDDIFETSKEYKTDIQKIIQKLEEKLKYNIKNYNINSPFYNEVIIIDEVHNFVRQIINKDERDNTTSRIFYEWIINSKNTKIVCLSGTPIINKPSEIAVLFNMIRGITKVYNFTIKPIEDVDINEIFEKCKDIFYKENSPVYQIKVFQKQGKIILSFMQNTPRFESIMNSDDRIVYTIQYNNHDFNSFIEHIYDGLHQLYKDENIIPSKKTFDGLDDKDKINIDKGDEVIFDKEVDIIFNVYRKLFDIKIGDENIDLTNNDNFMDYFFEETTEISDKKKVLLKRMLLGLTSYYPNDRSSIINMPEILKPNFIYDKYKEYNIIKKIQIELCPMSQKQFEKYYIAWLHDKEKSMKFNKKSMYVSDKSDYHINQRRICNMVYDNDSFRNIKIKDSETSYLLEKENEYNNLMISNSLKINDRLQYYSPKFNKILNNINKFVGSTSKGKILFYSEFTADAGTEIFEKILLANGYTKFDPNDNNDIKKYRYTFFTGLESQVLKKNRKINLDAFNEEKNKFGEYIQIMIISRVGAEGISLKNVRQVHILEPYWNYIRIDQVFGRAIRMKSHVELLPDNRNVEQYLYLSVFPDGNNIENVYKSLLTIDGWNVPNIEGNIQNVLAEQYTDLYDSIKKIIDIKTENINNTQDEKLFNIMEKKYNISQIVNNIIKESSVDCLQNTRDDINIYQNCVQFDNKIKNENSYFPGLTADKLSNIDTKQLEATILIKLKNNIFVISALIDDKKIFIYYQLKQSITDIDIRYIKENGKIIGLLDIDIGYFFMYIYDVHELDDKFGSKLSIYQKIFIISENIIKNVSDNNIFPEINEIKNDVLGYKIKNNITESFYYYPIIENKPIMRIFNYDESELNLFNTTNMNPVILYNTTFYIIN